ncbi:prephenate dehydratase [Alkalihalobacillus pseudalcaliphilus]|uniref:prephenate dehydratase n=1 Tax=Alkalihalobacillus pseudalcaliphilus TaxID=79884 RepID=UPI00064E1503|nr:prephenate dehydratase [Alkalihalobacillus pseudalcaliphilus]KMK75704.1 prephenate dehydratase [Alkalihalobacillus pseudalcaliphilus]
MTQVAYLGPKGTFTEIAARAAFPDYSHKPFQTIPACIDAVSDGEAELAIVPIENAIEGSVNLTLDYLIHKKRLPIIGSMTVPVAQHLFRSNWQKETKEEPVKVLSHPHAIAQCHDYLQMRYPNIEFEYTNSTAQAAKWIADNPKEHVIGIGNELAAAEYGLDILEYNIHDFDNNRTRFFVLAKNKDVYRVSGPFKLGDKTTLMITLPSDYSGALHQVLSAFAWRKLNLSKIESRPTKTGLGNYFFLIDVDYRLDDILIPGVVAELETLGCGVDILGSYESFSVTAIQENVSHEVL